MALAPFSGATPAWLAIPCTSISSRKAPVAPIVTFKTMDEVVERANSLEYGLAAYAFTSSAQTATMIGDAMQSGMVGVNSIAISTPETPFGGVKESGIGREGSKYGIEEFVEVKYLLIGGVDK